jgi:hypothetical protein
MHRPGFALLATALLFAVTGCGDSGVQEGPIEYKSPNTQQLGALKDSMIKNVTSAEYKKKGAEPKAAATKAAETKPGESKSAEKKD